MVSSVDGHGGQSYMSNSEECLPEECLPNDDTATPPPFPDTYTEELPITADDTVEITNPQLPSDQIEGAPEPGYKPEVSTETDGVYFNPPPCDDDGTNVGPTSEPYDSRDKGSQNVSPTGGNGGKGFDNVSPAGETGNGGKGYQNASPIHNAAETVTSIAETQAEITARINSMIE
ncbi:MAG: hypothetical protein WC527_08125 [Candidatus Margulisiibacteriota bacterium]